MPIKGGNHQIPNRIVDFEMEGSQLLGSGMIAACKVTDSHENQKSNQPPKKQFVPFQKGNVLRDLLFLILICFAGFGIYFVYDLPAAVGVDFKTATNMSQSDFMFTFYSLYSYPSAISAVFSGILIDNIFGLGLGGVVFAALAVVSQIVIFAGLHFRNNFLLGFGRFLHGTASEPLGVVRSTYNAKYFPDAVYYGMVLAASRAGSVGGFLLIPPVLCWAYSDSPTCRVAPVEISSNTTDNSFGNFSENVTLGFFSDTPDFDIDQIFYALQVCIVIGTGAVITAMLMMIILMKIDTHFDRKLGNDQNAAKSMLKLSSVQQFPLGAWCLILIFMFFYSSIFPFNTMLPDYLKEHLGFNKEQASYMSSVVYLLSVVGAPGFGKIVDMTKKHPIWALSACTGLGISQCAWGWIVQATPEDERSGLYWTIFALNFINGICYSIIASTISPWLGKMMPMKLKATAFGLLFGIQQLGVGSITYLLGQGVDKLGWTYFPYLCGFVSFVSAAVCVITIFVEGVDPWEGYVDEINEVEDITVSRRSFVS